MRALLRAIAFLPVLTLAQPAVHAAPPGPRVAPPSAAAAAAAPAAAGDEAAVRAALAAKIPGVKPEELRPSPVPGLWELARGADVTYLSADGRFILAGDLYQISRDGEYPNLSDARRRELRARLLGELPESQMIVFAPKTAAKYTVTVFTDPDCTWCRRLHSQIAEYNRLGIKVRYAFFPREGPDSEAWLKSEAVWCSSNRQDALTRAKLGQAVQAKACANTPVRHTWEVGRELGIEGTPGLVLGDGELIPGYLPPQALLKRLGEAGTRKSAAAASPAADRQG